LGGVWHNEACDGDLRDWGLELDGLATYDGQRLAPRCDGGDEEQFYADGTLLADDRGRADGESQ
jgi:hypothetical protein